MSTFGPAYSAVLDGARLTKQRDRIRHWMLRQDWASLWEIAQALDYPEASVSAQLRHLRKRQFGGLTVEKRRRTSGLWEYKVSD